MGLFKELSERKQKGEQINFEDITPEVLRTLFIDEEKADSLIAQLFDVKASKITYRRKKYGITIRNAILDKYLLGKSDKAMNLNEEARREILVKDNITMISKAITHFAFRNGPVEEIHANNQLSEEDMKTLNKFMVNRLAYVVNLIIEDRWIEFYTLIRSHDWMYGHDWDEAEIDDGEMRKYIELELKELRKR